MKDFLLLILLLLMMALPSTAQKNENSSAHYNTNKFRQLYQELPTPNNQHTASGAPGYEYTQQKVDYKMDIVLDDEKQRIYGEETITYHNNSKDDLEYLWIQLDQNIWDQDSDQRKIKTENDSYVAPSTRYSSSVRRRDTGFGSYGKAVWQPTTKPSTIELESGM